MFVVMRATLRQNYICTNTMWNAYFYVCSRMQCNNYCRNINHPHFPYYHSRRFGWNIPRSAWSRKNGGWVRLVPLQIERPDGAERNFQLFRHMRQNISIFSWLDSSTLSWWQSCLMNHNRSRAIQNIWYAVIIYRRCNECCNSLEVYTP